MIVTDPEEIQEMKDRLAVLAAEGTDPSSHQMLAIEIRVAEARAQGYAEGQLAGLVANEERHAANQVGFVVLTRNVGEPWDLDWDGILFPHLDDAIESHDEALAICDDAEIAVVTTIAFMTEEQA